MKTGKFAITLELCAPVLTKSSTPGQHGVDAAMARGSFLQEDGSLKESWYLPGTHVKGLLRESWQELAAVDRRFDGLLVKWLGKTPGDDDTPDTIDPYEQPDRGKLFFDDMVLDNAPAETGLRYRIAIDDTRGAADSGKLAILESPFAPGTLLKFKGAIRLTCPDNTDTKSLRTSIRTGLQWIRAAGAMRSVGFGAVSSVSVGQLISIRKRGNTVAQPQMPASFIWKLGLTFDRPICFAKRRIAGNLFESEEFVPGAALKAAVAAMIAQETGDFGALRAELYKVRFTHAQPAGALQWPLSLLAFDDAFEDAIRSEQFFTRDGKAGKFDIDWKERNEWAAVWKAYGHSKIEREIRVRTAINGESRAAADSELFAAETLLPFGIDWLGEANTESLSSDAREQLFRVLSCELQPLGKTKAYATVSIADALANPLPVAPDYVVTLTSPTLLVDPSRHLAPNPDSPGSQAASAMAEAYRDAWHELSLGALHLERFFHRLYLAGGRYFRRRFQGLAGAASGYKPYLMSSAGSTFLLKPLAGQEAQAYSLLQDWIVNGLPLPASVKAFYGLDTVPAQDLWKNCPWLPENGYGATVVNQPRPAGLQGLKGGAAQNV